MKIMVVLSVNEIIVDIDTNNFYRIIWIDSGYMIVYVIDINDPIAIPFIMLIKEIEERIETAEIVVQIDKGIFLKREPTKKDIEHRDRTWDAIKELVKLEPEIYDKNKRKKLIIEEMVKHGVKSHKTLYKYLRKYWQRGMIKDCLFPDYALNKVVLNYKVNEKVNSISGSRAGLSIYTYFSWGISKS